MSFQLSRQVSVFVDRLYRTCVCVCVRATEVWLMSMLLLLVTPATVQVTFTMLVRYLSHCHSKCHGSCPVPRGRIATCVMDLLVSTGCLSSFHCMSLVQPTCVHRCLQPIFATLLCPSVYLGLFYSTDFNSIFSQSIILLLILDLSIHQ